MDSAGKIAVVKQYLEAVSSGNLEMIKSIYADNASVEDPVGTPPHQGMEAILKFYGATQGMNLQLELKDTPKCAGNAVAFPFTVKIGTHSIDVIDVFEFDAAGKVVSMKAYWGPENRK